jgi:predicted RNA-binding Zn-ribbon protein involved in translation (DUF1610 family)
MQTPARNKGPWIHRFLTIFFSAIFGVLCFWLLGFVVDDLGNWPGPVYEQLEASRLDPALVEQNRTLEGQILDTGRRIADEQARQQLLRDSTSNSQTTMNQLLEFQRSNLEKNLTPSASERQALAESEQQFLANQAQYQRLNDDLVRLNEQLRGFNGTQRAVQERLEAQREPIRREFESQVRTHDLKMAALKLAVLIPLLVAAVVLFVKRRNGPYAPIIYAFGGAVLLKVGLVMHQYFPSRYFKYILILAAIAVVFQILLYLVRMVAFPKKDWLLKQYREAYESFLCPMCSYPIRRGPLKYMSWTRRTIKKMMPQPAAAGSTDEAYVCPMCSTRLYEECETCRTIRHSLLPSCQTCGRLRAVAS